MLFISGFYILRANPPPRSHLPALRASRMVNELPASVLLLPHQHSSTWTDSLRQKLARRMLEKTSRLHKALQDQHRRHAVHSLDAALRADLIFTQQTVGLGRSESLIP